MKPTKFNSYRHVSKRFKEYCLFIDSRLEEYLINPSQEEVNNLFERAAKLQCRNPKTVVHIDEVSKSGYRHFFKTPLF